MWGKNPCPPFFRDLMGRKNSLKFMNCTAYCLSYLLLFQLNSVLARSCITLSNSPTTMMLWVFPCCANYILEHVNIGWSLTLCFFLPPPSFKAGYIGKQLQFSFSSTLLQPKQTIEFYFPTLY